MQINQYDIDTEQQAAQKSTRAPFAAEQHQ
jgi:hypothetical protein